LFCRREEKVVKMMEIYQEDNGTNREDGGKRIINVSGNLTEPASLFAYF